MTVKEFLESLSEDKRTEVIATCFRSAAHNLTDAEETTKASKEDQSLPLCKSAV